MSTATKSDGPVKIKKYANRRLYNTGTSTYVTLEDLATMVKSGEDFAVFVNALHPQALDVFVAVARVNRVIPCHH